MVITYYGAGCFKVQSGETVLAFNPPSKESEFKSPRFASDIVLVSSNHKDYNGWENLPGKAEGSKPFVAEGNGEYEISGIYIKASAPTAGIIPSTLSPLKIFPSAIWEL